MDKNAVSERLRALASDDNKRSKAARLRDVIDDVEAALNAGVTRQDVLDVLKGQGLEMSLVTFETTLRRIRAKRSEAHQSRTPRTAPVSPSHASHVSPGHPSIRPSETSHDPVMLDKITGTAPNLDELSKAGKKRT